MATPGDNNPHPPVPPHGALRIDLSSVCTFTKAETDDVIADFCEEHPEFIKTIEMRLWPHRDAADAHYAAVFVRQ